MSSLSDDVFGYDDPYYLKWSTWYQVCFALGMLGAGSVLLTGYMFWKEMVTDKIYMKLLMAMSLCDALASFMGLFGFGHDNEFVCVWQGVTWYFFNRASWMFMMCITLTLFTQVNYDRVSL